jgi:hypothetical protein
MSRIILILTLAALVAGCAGAPARPAGSPLERAQARWDLVIAGETAKAYDYLTPGFRSMTSREQYVSSQALRPVRRKQARVTGADCPEGELHCDVAVELDVEVPPGFVPGRSRTRTTAMVTERWLLLDGAWYYAPKEIARGAGRLR